MKKTREVSEKPQSSLDGNQQQIQHSCKSKSGPDWWQAKGLFIVVCLGIWSLSTGKAGVDFVLIPQYFSYRNADWFEYKQNDSHMKSSEVCIKTKLAFTLRPGHRALNCTMGY